MNHYDVLGVRPTASNQEIDLAYRARRTQYHPDNRPRKGLGVRTPLAVYRQLLLSHTEPQSSLVQ